MIAPFVFHMLLIWLMLHLASRSVFTALNLASFAPEVIA
jgi:hypothetical protein